MTPKINAICWLYISIRFAGSVEEYQREWVRRFEDNMAWMKSDGFGQSLLRKICKMVDEYINDGNVTNPETL